MLEIFSLSNIHHFPWMLILVFYLPQEVYGLFRFQDQYSVNLLAFTGVAFVTYYGSYYILDRKKSDAIKKNNKICFRMSFNFFAAFFGIGYIVLIVYTALTAKEIALFSAFGGAGIDQIGNARELFLRTRTGWEVSLKYLYAIMTAVIMPYIITSLFVMKYKVRHLVLAFFLFSLMLTLEKSVSIIAILPLFVMSVEQKNYKSAIGFLLLLILIISLTVFLSRGGITELRTTIGVQAPSSSVQAPSPSSTSSRRLGKVPDKYNIFGKDTQAFYIINRVTWIPYMAAYDWLRFRKDILGNGYTFGRSIHGLSWITGKKYYPLEQEVFKYQWGQNATGTGSANTVYFIDAFLNFGLFGVIFYSIILALVLRVISKSNDIPAKSVSTVPLFYLTFNSLSGILFSGGLMFLLIILMVTDFGDDAVGRKGEILHG